MTKLSQAYYQITIVRIGQGTVYPPHIDDALFPEPLKQPGNLFLGVRVCKARVVTWIGRVLMTQGVPPRLRAI